MKQALTDVAAMFEKMAGNYQKLDPDSAEFKALKQQVDAALEAPEPEGPAATASDFETKVLEGLETLELHLAVLAGQPN